jgi:parallel beta-helix repeat protein
MTFVREVKCFDSGATIIIKADGSIDPPTALISTVDNVTYVFTADINNQSIFVQKSNITIDGRGHVLQGSYINFSYGMSLSDMTNVTIENMRIDAFWYGIFVDSGSNNRISGNNITNNVDALFLQSSANDSISGNNITDNNGWGVTFFDSYNETLSRNNITSNHAGGVALGPSANDAISENNVTDNTGDGIMLYGILNYTTLRSSTVGNTITNNNVRNNKADGIKLISSTNNTISGNNIIENQLNIEADYSSHNMIYNNNFVSNAQQVLCNTSRNTWDSGYPSGGNYWSNYNGTDADHDGIGNTEYSIDTDNADRYPLMGMFYCSPMMWQEKSYAVNVISNSTVSRIGHVVQTISQWPNHTVAEEWFDSIYFYVSGADGTIGFCRVDIPVDLLNATYKVYVNNTEVSCNLLPCSNSTHSYLYFNYTHSTQRVEVISEFSIFLVLSLFMIATALTTVISRALSKRVTSFLSAH